MHGLDRSRQRTRIRHFTLVSFSLFILLLLMCFSGGCASLPDVRPFVDATYQMKSAVAQAGTTVTVELRYMEGGEAHADRLAEAWEARNKAFAAIAAYSDSLHAIVAAGEQGAKTGQQLADSIKGFAEAAGIALPGSSEAIAVATDAVKLIVENISKARAAKTLKESMLNAQHAVEGIVELIIADLKDLDDIFRAANKLIETKFRIAYNEKIGYRKDLEKLIFQTEISGITDEGLKRVVQLNQLLQGTNTWYMEYNQGIKEINRRLKLSRALIQTAQSSIDQWINAHRQVVSALVNRKPVSVRSLLETSKQIHDLVRKVREL